MRNIKIKKNKNFVLKNVLENKKVKNNCVLFVYEIKDSLLNDCLSSVLDHIFESSFFETLRTQK